jgi:broad specificity phosphatase PhoE
MTDFWLIRHGSTDALNKNISGRAPGVLLNDRGRVEIAALARRLSRLHAGCVYASPLERTAATAETLAQQLGCEVIYDDAFAELHFGDWTGRSFVELDADEHWRRFNVFRSGTCIPGGESMLDVQARAVRALLALRAQHSEGRVLIVTHGDVIKAVIMYFLGIALDLCGRLELSPASITQLELSEHGARVLRINDVSHNE